MEVRRTALFPDRPESTLICLGNPQVLGRDESATSDWEGCFSIPRLFGVVRRAEAVKVRHVDVTGRTVTSTFAGYVARVVQHEIDHLQGRVFLSRMDGLESLTTDENLEDARARHAAAARRQAGSA